MTRQAVLIIFSAPLPNFQTFTRLTIDGLAQLRLGHEVEAQEVFQKAIDASGGHYAEPISL